MIIKKNVGELIRYIDERNITDEFDEFLGININKEFMPTAANVDSVDSKKYKVVRKGRFVFSGMQTGRDKTIRIALYSKDRPAIVSPAYTTFEIEDSNVILPEYFYMLFLRPESDRFGWFISDSSVRANLDTDRFEEISFMIPPLDIQKKYVNLYNAINRVPELKEEIQKIVSVLIKAALKEAEEHGEV